MAIYARKIPSRLDRLRGGKTGVSRAVSLWSTLCRARTFLLDAISVYFSAFSRICGGIA